MAMEYQVRVREILEREVSVVAESMAQAQELVEKDYRNSEIILDAADYKGVSFAALYPQYRDYER